MPEIQYTTAEQIEAMREELRKAHQKSNPLATKSKKILIIFFSALALLAAALLIFLFTR